MTLKINREDDTMAVVQKIKKCFGDLPDITMECTGVEACINVAISGTKEGGKVALVGLNHNKVSVSLSRAGFNELELIGVRRYKDNWFVFSLKRLQLMKIQNSFSDSIDLVSKGKINIKPLISHVFKLEEAVKAFETATKCADGVIKVQIVCAAN